jgi:hypothetical protein
MTPEAITDEWMSEQFQTEVRITERSRIGDGLVGMNLRLRLEAGDGAAEVPSALVVKLPSPDPTSRATGTALRNYEREVKFYQSLAATVDIRVARCYYADWTESDGDFVLLLEDLSPASQGDQIIGCGADHARLAVLELARLHGPRWGDPALHDLEWLSRQNSDAAAQLTMLWGMFVPGFLGTYAKYLDTEQVALIERFGGKLTSWLDARTGELTVTHGDYRLDNLMFATPAGGPAIATVDWQSPGHGPGIADVSYFLGAGPLPELRRSIERDLVSDYATALVDNYGLTLDEAELWDQYRLNAYAGVIMSVIASQLVGGTERSEGMFAAMATRHTQHALDVAAESLL